jgi:formylglycine-generating enzyme
MRTSSWPRIACGCGFAVWACSAFTVADPTLELGPLPDAGTSSDNDSGVEAAAPAKTCPDGMVKMVDAFCIDMFEVSVMQYQTFLQTASDAGADPRCSNHADFSSNAALPGGLSKPVVGIDFCDALTFCTSAGKRLCQRRRTLLNGDEWRTACTANNSQTTSYKATFDAGACVLDANKDAAATRAALDRTCEGATPGVYNMAGNVHEWTDTVANPSDGGVATSAQFWGGAYGQPAAETSCGTDYGAQHLGFRALDVGFRCCADLR